MMDTGGARDVLDALCVLDIGKARSHQGLTVWPLVASGDSPVEYVLLDHAVAAGTLTITELNPEKSIPYLTFANRSPHPVLVFAGEELAGTRQNRVCSSAIMVGTGVSMMPVSCVEQGQWDRMSASFSPGTSAAHSGHLDEYVAPLDCADDQALTGMTGVAVFFEGRIVCVDILQPPAFFRELYRRLLHGYALEALVLTNKREFLTTNHINTTSGAREADSSDRVTGGDDPTRCDPPAFIPQLLEELRDATVSLHPALDLGEVLRLQTASVSGTGLIWNGALVQLSLFPRPAT